MEELSSQFTDSYNRVWGFRLGGKWVESVFGIKSERDVLSLAFHFFHLPNLSTRSLVCISVFLFNSNNASIFSHFFFLSLFSAASCSSYRSRRLIIF
jgi:hypothetical protein